MMEVFKHMMFGKVLGPSKVYADMILSSGHIGNEVFLEFCHSIFFEK